LEEDGLVMWGVSVTPKGSAVFKAPYTNSVTASFTVRNTGTCPDTFNLSPSARGSITNVTVTPTRIPNLGPNASQQVTVTYNVGAIGSDTLILTAVGVLGSESDNGSYNVTVVPPYAVVVTPDSATTAPRHGYTGEVFRDTFTVKNIGSTTDTYQISCMYAGPVTCTGTDSLHVTLAFLDSTKVTASFTAGGGGPGTLILKATGSTGVSDSGFYSVPVLYPVTLIPDVLERNRCVTISAGAGAAFECGDLRLAHPLPSVRTRNTTRTPVLVYNSRQAHPYPLVSADVTLPYGHLLPTTVKATLTVSGVQYVQSWPGNNWGAWGQTRRIVVGFDAIARGLGTGIWGYTLEVRRITGTSDTLLYTASDSLLIVNRSTSPFGAGWWLAGYERLFFTVPNGQVLWVGGDGSVRRYFRAAQRGTDTAYVAPPLDHPDTILHRSDSLWVRLLPAGATVTFWKNGFHQRTTDRLGQSTVFTNSDSLLMGIDVPPSGSGLSYTFSYTGSPAQLASVSAPDSAPGTNRVTTVSRVGDSLRITDPGSPAVVFAYEPTQSGRIVSRRDRRGAVTAYSYDAGYRLSTSRLALGGADSINTTYCAAEVRGLAACSPTLVQPESVYTIFHGPRPDSTAVVHFWADRFGVTQVRDPYLQITSITRGDPRWPALATRVQYPNQWVLAATYDARGHIATSTDSSMSVGGNYATTTYTWDQRWDGPIKITRPQGDFDSDTLDATTGNRLWQQDARGPMSRVTFAYYTAGNGTGLLKTVNLPDGARDSIGYDTLGNVAVTRSPLGWFVYTTNDRLGRPIVVRTQLDTGGTLYRYDSTSYDVRNRVVRTVSVGPARSGVGVQTVVVRQFYNDESRVDSLQRWTVPDSTLIGTSTTRWHYDLAGRPVAIIAPDGARDSTRYDPAGNATVVVPRRGAAYARTMIYDRMNRLVRRSTPSVTYQARSAGIAQYPYFDANLNSTSYHSYPFFPLDTGTGGLTIPADVATFGYDQMGSLVRADNGDAFVRRAYFPNGLLNSDTLKILTYATRDSTKNVYVIQHRYDLNRRQTVLKHPWQLAPRIGAAVADSVRYLYNAATGAIDTVIDPMGKRFDFTYNARNERTRLGMPGQISDNLTYNLDGRWLRDSVWNGSTSTYRHADTVLRQTVLTYIDAQRVAVAANRAGWKDTTTSTYTGLGQLRELDYVIPESNTMGHAARATSSQQFSFDPLGNVYAAVKNSALLVEDYGTQQNPSTAQVTRYESGTGRHRADSWADASRPLYRRDSVLYDPAGNTEFSYQTYSVYATPSTSGTLLEDRASFYGADGKLRVTEYRQEQLGTNQPGDNAPYWDQKYTFEEYRYDALGRRVLARTRRQMCPRSQQLSLNGPCRLSTIRRTVWDGAQELYEIQMPGGDTASAATMDNDTLAVQQTPNTSPGYWDLNPQFGRVAYTDGPTLDQPLSVTRIGYRDSPYNDSTHVWTPLTIAPHWNWRGQADYGTFADGGIRQCLTGTTRCVTVGWRASAFAFEPAADTMTAWYGTLIAGKEDGSGQLFRRNRYVDPATGRFTQEDPIGLAGGINLYGFAKGDPVNFSDPFGLCLDNDAVCAAVVAWLRKQKGALFQQAADVFAKIKKTVHWVRGDDSNLNKHAAGNVNRDRDPLTWLGGRTDRDDVYLNVEFSSGDRLLSAEHEARVHMLLPIPLPVEEYSGEVAAYNQLSVDLRETAVRWGNLLGIIPNEEARQRIQEIAP